jgi:DNA-binding NarL/FixJ family response regulator
MALRYDPLDQLTPRQLNIIRLTHAGKSDEEICTVLRIFPGTLRWHIHRIRGVFPLFRRLVRTSPLCLTAREQKIADGVVQGLTNAEIAERMGITIQSVCNALCVLYEKTGSRNRTQLAVCVTRHQVPLNSPEGTWV